MACAGFNCSYHDVGNGQCFSHRDPCGTNGVAIGQVTIGSVITSSTIDQIRSEIVNQVNAWNNWLTNTYNSPNPSAYPVYNPGTLGVNVTISATHVNQLNSDLIQLLNYSALGGQNPNVPGSPTTPTNHAVNGARSVSTGSAVVANPVATVTVNSLIQATEWNKLINAYNAVRQNCICNSDCHCNQVCACFNDCGCNYSDERLKENIKLIGQKFGLNIYEFNYIGDDTKKFIGAMAQELLNSAWAGSVSKDSNGYYQVDYSRLPIDMKEVI